MEETIIQMRQAVQSGLVFREGAVAVAAGSVGWGMFLLDHLEGTLGGSLAQLDRSALVTFAAGGSDLAAVAAAAREAELSARGPQRTRRQTPEGEVLEWELLFLQGH